MQRCVAGAVYRPGEGVEEGWVLHDGGRVLDSGQGKPPQAPDATGVVIPSPVDAHVHVGDRVARGAPLDGLTLAQVVKPPDGLKHRILRETPEEALVAGMREAARELLAGGCRAFLDFREGGLDGVRLLRRAVEGLPVRAVALGRAPSWSDEEVARVLEAADGIGFPGLRDAEGDAPERAAEACRRAGKPFSLHLSEDERDDVARALALGPAFLVHLVEATSDDLEAVAEAGVPVVACPRSNARFRLGKADVPAMLERGIAVALGSDNAMLHPLGALLDARQLLLDWPALPREAALDACLAGGRRVLDGRAPRSWLRRGDPADLVVFEMRGDPLDALVGEAPPRLVHAPWAPGGEAA